MQFALRSKRSSKMNEHLPHLDNIVISHRALMRARQRLETSLMQNGHNIAIYGDYGVGKTTLLRSFIDQQTRIQRSVPTKFSVLSVSVPFRPTITSLAQRILCGLGESCDSQKWCALPIHL
jgi:ATPase subunit of ABC transporter with duplicated ATPase domains